MRKYSQTAKMLLSQRAGSPEYIRTLQATMSSNSSVPRASRFHLRRESAVALGKTLNSLRGWGRHNGSTATPGRRREKPDTSKITQVPSNCLELCEVLVGHVASSRRRLRAWSAELRETRARENTGGIEPRSREKRPEPRVRAR